MIEAQSPMYGPYKTAQEQARAAERQAVAQALEEERAKQDVTPRLDQIEQTLSDWRAIIERARLLRGDWPMSVVGDIVSIDPSALNADSGGGFAAIVVTNGILRNATVLGSLGGEITV